MQLLIDSQADVSIIKVNDINANINLNNYEQIYLKGITDQVITSLGTTNMKIKFNDRWVSHKVHVVPETFEIPVGGILGKDFLKTFNCNIDYSTMTLTINTTEISIVLNIFEGPGKETTIIPARCEVIRHFKVCDKVNLTEDQVLNPTEIAPGIILARTIFNPNAPFVRIINTTSEPKTIKRTLPKSENLSNFDIYSINEIDTMLTDRKAKIKELITEGVPKYLQEDLTELAMKYSDVFALKSDKMTVNNFYSQKLRINDHEPVYVKNYRCITHALQAGIYSALAI